MSKKSKTDDEAADAAEERKQLDHTLELARHRARRHVVDRAVEAAEGKSHMRDRLELVRRYVAGVAHEFELLMADHRDRYGELERALDWPSEALGKAASDYASGGELGNFLLALDAYNAELRRIAAGFPPRSSSD